MLFLFQSSLIKLLNMDIFIVKSVKIFFLSTAHYKKIRLKIPLCYREIVKNKNISLSYDVNDHVYSKPKIRLTL